MFLKGLREIIRYKHQNPNPNPKPMILEALIDCCSDSNAIARLVVMIIKALIDCVVCSPMSLNMS